MGDTGLHIRTPEQVNLQFTLAGIGSRAIAHLIDISLLCIVDGLLITGLALLQWLGIGRAAVSYVAAVVILIVFLTLWGYFIVFEYFLSGRTPGKKLVHIRTISLDGRPISFFAATVRNLLRLVDFLPTGYLAGIICMLIDGKERRIGDIGAGTVVVVDRPLWHLPPLSQPAATQTPGDDNQRQDSVAVTLAGCDIELVVHTPLPAGWEGLLEGFETRRRRMSKQTREVLVQRLFRQLLELPQVQATRRTAAGSSEEVQMANLLASLSLRQESGFLAALAKEFKTSQREK